MSERARLTQGPVASTVAKLAAPMVMGLFSVIAFNLTDTYFVSQLGTEALAAMSFTFPVIMVMLGLAMGLGTGTASVISRAIGKGDESTIRRLASDSLMLSFLLVLALATIGILTIEPLFTLLGATPQLMPLIKDYMAIWYVGMICLVIPIVAVATIRSTGDTLFPALMMVGATAMNFVLDPLFIFGLWGVPRLELQGAAIATVISRATTLIASLILLHFREHLLDFKIPNLRAVWHSWKQIGAIAAPAIATNFMEPLGLAFITRIIASHGPSSVAAWGAGSRITAFAMIPVFALSSGMIPFIGQNWGAGEYHRVRQARNYGYVFAMIWSIFVILLLHLFAELVAHIFSIEPEVTREIVRYLWIIPFGYFGISAYSITEETLNAIGRPILASLQTFIHLFVLYIPLAYLGTHLMSINGLFGGLVIADILGGAIGVGLAWWQCRKPDPSTEQNAVQEISA